MRSDTSLEFDILAAAVHDSRYVPSLMRLVDADDFASEKGRRLFDAVSQVAKRDGAAAVAPATVRAELRRVGADERTVVEILDPLLGIGSVGSFEPKCHRLRDFRLQRFAARGMQDLISNPDPEAVASGLQDLLHEVSRLEGHKIVLMADIIDELLDERERELSDEARCRTSLPTLDRMLGGGFAPGWLAVVGARTGVGKTLFAVQVAAQAMTAGKRVLYVSLEEGRTQIVERVIRHIRRIPQGVRSVADPLFAAGLQADIRSLPLVVETGGDLDPMLAGIAEEAMATEGLGLVVVDYVGLIRVSTRENRVQQISEATRRLKNLAMSLRLPVLLLAQVNRSPLARTDRRPTLSDLRDSGSLEQDGDVVVLLHRDSEIGGRVGALRLAKNRYGAPTEFAIGFEYPLGRIVETVAEPTGSAK
jgi:replicative DNA helicase